MFAPNPFVNSLRSRVIRRALVAAVILLASPHVVFAHPGQLPEPHDLWTAWTFSPAVLIGIAISIALYVRGLRAVSLRITRARAQARRRTICFGSGLLVIALALISPIDAVGNALFSVHMVQHLLLTVVAAPLLVMGEPLLVMFWAIGARRRRSIALWWRRATSLNIAWHALTLPLVAWTLHVTLLWVWHLPRLYDAALLNGAVHVAEHIAFLASALLFWWVAFDRRRLRIGGAVLYLFAAGLQCTLLGALLAMAHTPWFFVHYGTTQPWGLTPLEDQQLAGLIMWIPAGAAYLVALLPRLISLLRERAAVPGEALLSS